MDEAAAERDFRGEGVVDGVIVEDEGSEVGEAAENGSGERTGDIGA